MNLAEAVLAGDRLALARTLTLRGAVANLIVAETAKARGVHLTFGEYLKAGVPITLSSLAIGIIWLSLIP